MQDQSTKTCRACGVEKPLDGFYVDKSASPGHRRPDCIPCYTRICVERARKNPVRKAERIRLWRKANPERTREQGRNYYYAHQEERRAARRDYYTRFPLHDRELVMRNVAARFGVLIEPVSYQSVLDRDGLWCYLCQAAVDRATLSFDHVKALSRGGAHAESNIRVTHLQCNRKKYTNDPPK